MIYHTFHRTNHPHYLHFLLRLITQHAVLCRSCGTFCLLAFPDLRTAATVSRALGAEMTALHSHHILLSVSSIAHHTNVGLIQLPGTPHFLLAPYGLAPMAEAAGLALGAVALVSLFQTTVELLEYVQAAKGLASDGQLADTKLGLLEERLRQWGDDLQVEHPGKEDVLLRQRWDHEGGLVTKSLNGISEILSNASQLSEKYGLHKKRRLVWNSSIPSLHPIIQKTNTLSLSSPRKSSGNSPSVRKQAIWAIKDKKRFDSLIADLDFFITNLEKVSGRLLKFGMYDLV